MARLESHVEKRLTKACKKRKIRTVKVPTENYNGFVDRIVFNQHIKKIHYLEIKNETYYERTRNQMIWASIIIACGGIYFLIDGEDEMKAYIKKYIEG